MTLLEVRQLVTVPDNEMLPRESHFLHASRLHGVAHVGRVMIHALHLVAATGWREEMPRLWAAVYLHDLGRTDDGVRPKHGADGWARLEKLPEVRDRFQRGGVREADWPAIQAAVTRHSYGEAKPGEPHARLIELLKDADGLDRVRLWDLDARYLRIPQSRTMVGFAERLFRETNGADTSTPDYFSFLWGETERLLSAFEVR